MPSEAGPVGTGTWSPVERVYHAWDDALARSDVEGLLALYAPDAMIETPLVPYLLNLERPVRGHEEIRTLFEKLAGRKPPVRRHHRTGYLTDGKKLVWEYPRATPDGDQMDFVEVMELNESGLIQNHRIYWGWYGFGVMKRNEYHK